MKASYSNLMQSKYFSPAFNSAIFDGPLRIYFAQFHESMALKIYFLSQQQLSEELSQAKDISKAAQANILVMIYPNEENFDATFGDEAGDKEIIVETWNDDVVIGLRRPLEDSELENMMLILSKVMKTWAPKNSVAFASPEL